MLAVIFWHPKEILSLSIFSFGHFNSDQKVIFMTTSSSKKMFVYWTNWCQSLALARVEKSDISLYEIEKCLALNAFIRSQLTFHKSSFRMIAHGQREHAQPITASVLFVKNSRIAAIGWKLFTRPFRMLLTREKQPGINQSKMWIKKNKREHKNTFLDRDFSRLIAYISKSAKHLGIFFVTIFIYTIVWNALVMRGA